MTVERLQYCFHESEPDSRPPPVCFSPPNAPPIPGIRTMLVTRFVLRVFNKIQTLPISAPDGDVLTFTKPQSDPLGPIH